MKKSLFYVFLTGLGMMTAISCQSRLSDDEAAYESRQETVTFQINLPDDMFETKAGSEKNSKSGGLANVDFTKYDLRYQLAIYRQDGADYVQAIAPKVQVVDKYEPVSYTLRLTPNRNYKVVVWADFVEQGKTDDLHYNTTDLRNVSLMTDVLNEESKDAYFVSHEFTVERSPFSLVLRRPFAKLRLVTTDWNYANLEMPDNFKVSYYGCRRFDHFDLVTGTALSEELPETGNPVYTGTIDKAVKEYTADYDASENNRTIITDYLFTDFDQQSPIHFTFEALDGTTLISALKIDTDIPIKRNWLTTVIGNTLTQGSDMNIEIDESFDGENTNNI